MSANFDIPRTLAAGSLSGLMAVAIGGVIHGWLFHDFQRHTPDTWRQEGPMHIALGSAALFLSGITYAFFFAPLGSMVMYSITHWVTVGVIFGIGCWAALALPLILSISVFVNLHRGVVLGLLIEWLLISITSG